MNVIVTGSLGNIGKPLATELVEKGHTVTVISSKPEKQKDIEALGAKAAIGSLEDVDFLMSTFTDADAVFAMVPPDFTELNQVEYYQRIGRNYAQAIQQSGIKRLVHLSSMGAHLDRGTGFILGSHHIEIPPAVGFKVRYVGSEEHTANAIAHILGIAIGKPDLKWITFTNEQMQDGLEKKGMPSHLAANFVEMGASIHSGALRQDYELHQPIAMGKVKLEDFAKEFAAAFQKR